MSKLGLVLSGGGARGAYQAGVIRGLIELTKQLPVTKNPFQIITGISAGSINGAFLAGHADDLELASRRLNDLWCNLSTDQVYKVNPFSLGKIGLKLLAQLTTGSVTGQTSTRALLNTAPLRELLHTNLPMEGVARNLQNGNLEALAITATDYASAHSVTFVQGRKDIPMWQRSRRLSQRDIINADHVMASSAIPMLFPPQKVGERYFGDGGLRNSAPLSPAVHLGAEKIIVVSVKNQNITNYNSQPVSEPSLARILSVVINGLLMDAIDFDVERLSRINSTLKFIGKEMRDRTPLKPVDYLWITPSVYLNEIAERFVSHMPKTLRYLVEGLGSVKEGSDLISYMLFEGPYCCELADIGYEDLMSKKELVLRFLSPQ